MYCCQSWSRILASCQEGDGATWSSNTCFFRKARIGGSTLSNTWTTGFNTKHDWLVSHLGMKALHIPSLRNCCALISWAKPSYQDLHLVHFGHHSSDDNHCAGNGDGHYLEKDVKSTPIETSRVEFGWRLTCLFYAEWSVQGTEIYLWLRTVSWRNQTMVHRAVPLQESLRVARVHLFQSDSESTQTGLITHLQKNQRKSQREGLC